jgi:hypothetical protein
MSDNESEGDNLPQPARPKLPAAPPHTHTVSQYRRIGKRWGVYKTVGDASVPPCPHCGEPYTGRVKVYLDRLIAFGGGTGGVLLTPFKEPLPQLPKEFPEQREFDDKEIFPGA